MVKAFESLSGELTPLQKAALERIHDFERELKAKGIYVRSATELEFMTEDGAGNPAPDAFRLGAANDILRATTAHFEGLDYEKRVRGIPYDRSQYELHISDPAASGSLNPQGFSPAGVAAVTAHMKESTLDEVLRRTTSLSSPVLANFLAHPYPYLPDHKDQTSALHVNVSLYNEQGQNLLAESTPLGELGRAALLTLQSELALALLPNENSTRRIGRNPSAPTTFSTRYGTRNKGGTTAIEHGDTQGQRNRLENRLPGADADPYVAMALTMAALVDVTRNHLQEALPGQAADEPIALLPIGGKHYRVDRHDAITPNHQDEPIPTSHAELVRRFESASRHAKDLLGEKLYSAIRAEYAREPAAASR